VTRIARGSMETVQTVAATTVYLQKNQVISPISGYIMQVSAKPGDPVKKGQVLYSIESKERRAMGAWPGEKDSVASEYGIFKIAAPSDGFITSMEKQQAGDFVTEGLSLCSIADINTVYFQLNIPYEDLKFIRNNPFCSIILPDQSVVTARITHPLTQVNSGSQTTPYLAKPLLQKFFPEGLVATAKLISYKKGNAQLLPKQSILSDELMREFWVMKLLNDSTAVKVPVRLGGKTEKSVEIIEPIFSETDRILTSGNYGLSDTVLVKLIQ
jgi:hypothetical protein